MSIERYLTKEQQEDAIKALVEILIIPGLEALVKDSSNPYDDMALAAAKPMLLALVDKVDGKEG